MELTITAAKAAARVLREDMADSGIDITNSRALEVLAHQLGYRDWNTAAAEIGNRRDMGARSPSCVSRMRARRASSILTIWVSLSSGSTDSNPGCLCMPDCGARRR